MTEIGLLRGRRRGLPDISGETSQNQVHEGERPYRDESNPIVKVRGEMPEQSPDRVFDRVRERPVDPVADLLSGDPAEATSMVQPAPASVSPH
jgi:hypothetical protein